MYEIKESIKGIKIACKNLNYPVVSGNVSLYNETKKEPIYPTPVIGGVGVIKKLSYAKGLKMTQESDVFVLGKTKGHLELSTFNQIQKKIVGNPPKLDLGEELKNGNFVKKLIKNTKIIIGCHDLSDGGMALALAELCIANEMGIEITIPIKKNKLEGWLFGEDQSRYIIISNDGKKLIDLAKKEKVFIQKIGLVKGKSLNIKN